MLCTKSWGKAFNTCSVIPWFVPYKGEVCVHHVIPPILGYIFWNKEAQFCIDQHMRVLTEVGGIISNSLNDQKFMLKWHAKVYKGLIVSRGVVNDCMCILCTRKKTTVRTVISHVQGLDNLVQNWRELWTKVKASSMKIWNCGSNQLWE